MNTVTAENYKYLLTTYEYKIIETYTYYALLLNSCDIAKDRYENLEDNIILSTTKNIPKEFKNSIEIDMNFNKNELVAEYTSNILGLISSNFIGDLISLFDACLEDLYGEILKDNGESDNAISNKVRNSWRNDNIINYFIDTFNIKKPTGKLTTPVIAFSLYKELREFRHAIIHNNGVLSKKNKDNLSNFAKEALKSAQSEGIDQDKMLNMYDFFQKFGLIKDNKFKPNVYVIYFLRHWILNEFAYLRSCIDEMCK